MIALGCAAWLGIKLMRVHNPHLHVTLWTVGLVVAKAMSMLMSWMRVTITSEQMPVRLLPIVSPAVL